MRLRNLLLVLSFVLLPSLSRDRRRHTIAYSRGQRNEIRQHSGHHRQHAGGQDQPARAEGINLYVKIEAFNPLGSVKDRLALGVIEAAESDGSLKPGQTVVEATSGNTGIGLAMVCAAKGYPLVLTMAESFSVERRKLMRFLGAKVVLTPAAERASGMVRKCNELAAANGWFLTRQFENEANPDDARADHGAAKSSTTSRASSSITGSPASAPAARSRASAACCARSGRTPRSSSPNPKPRRC